MSSLFQVVLVLTTLTFIVVNSRSGRVSKESAQEFLTIIDKQFDENEDGTITDSEYAHGFQNHDDNKDGKMDKAEFEKYLTQYHNKFVSMSDYLFAIFDIDKSGFIELGDVKRVITEIDQDGNVLIDDAEFDRFIELFVN